MSRDASTEEYIHVWNRRAPHSHSDASIAQAANDHGAAGSAAVTGGGEQTGPVAGGSASTLTDRGIALAIDWARSNAGEHAAVIENALAAYDPERVGARTVRVPTSGVDIQALQEQAEAWEAVFETLNEVYPGWTSVRPEGTGVEFACEAIRHLAAQAPDLRPITDYVKD